MIRTFVNLLIIVACVSCLKSIANAQSCQPAGTVTAVTPCNATVSGNVTLTNSGTYSVSTMTVSGTQRRWQFLIETFVYWKDPMTGTVYNLGLGSQNSNFIEDCGVPVAAYPVQGYPFYSPILVDGTYISHGSISVQQTPLGGFNLLSEKNCDFTIDN